MAEEDNVKDATLLILQNIQASLGDLRKDVARVQTDLAVFREDVDHRFVELRDDLRGEFREVRDELRAEIQEVRDEMRVGFKATMKQNDRRFLDHEARIRALERRR
jgi:hypothetical protein